MSFTACGVYGQTIHDPHLHVGFPARSESVKLLLINLALGYGILVTDYKAQILSNWAAVLVTLVSPCIFTILLEFFHKTLSDGSRLCAWLKTRPLFRTRIASVQMPVQLEDLPPYTPNSRQTLNQHMQQQLESIEDQRDHLNGTWTLFRSLFRSLKLPVANRAAVPLSLSVRLHEDLREILAFTLVATFLFSAFVGVSAASILTARILKGSLALSDSPDCGIWRFDPISLDWPFYPNWSDSRYVPEWILRHTMDTVVDYRRDCYGTESSLPKCTKYATQMIPYNTRSNTSCPFVDWNTCLQGSHASYTLETPLLDSAVLGINAPTNQRYHFQRKMTCTPILKDTRYIRRYREGWGYFYAEAANGQEKLSGYNPNLSFPPIEETLGDWLRSKFITEYESNC